LEVPFLAIVFILKVEQGAEKGKDEKRGCPKSRIAPFAIVYFGKKNYLTVAKKQTL
jgi:hypothetical protein